MATFLYARMIMKIKLLFLLCLILATGSASAETVYVIDNLIITMRSGQSTQHQIIRTWPSSTRLEVLETGDKYSRVKGPGDTEGWVLNQYISPTPTAKIRLASAEKKLAQLEAENAQLKTEMNKVSGSEAGLSKQLKDLERKHNKLTNELTRLRKVAAIDEC